MEFLEAIYKSDIKLLNNLLKLPINLNHLYGDFKQTPLHIIIERNDVFLLQYLLEKPKLDVNLASLHGETPLIIACQSGKSKIVDLLLRKGKADVNKPLPNGQTPLHIAVSNRNLFLVRELIKYGADVNKTDCFFNSPLTLALTVPSYTIVKYLIKQGAHYLDSFPPDNVALFCKSLHDVELFSLAMINVEDFNKVNLITGWNCLHVAALTNCVYLAIFMLENGADLNIADASNRTPIQIAENHQNYSVLTVFKNWYNQ